MECEQECPGKTSRVEILFRLLVAELSVDEIVEFARDGLSNNEKEHVEKSKKNNGKPSKKSKKSFRKKKNQIWEKFSN